MMCELTNGRVCEVVVEISETRCDNFWRLPSIGKLYRRPFGTFQLDDYVSVGLVSGLYHDITLDGI